MEDMYKVIVTPSDQTHISTTVQNILNSEYSNGYEFVQMIPQHGYNCYWLIFKRDPYRQISDISPAQMWPETHFKTGKEISEDTGKRVNLRDILNFFSHEIEKGTPIRVYSKQNHSVVGSVIDSKELIPDNVYNYKYLNAKFEPNTRDKNLPDVLVITVE